MKYFEFRTTKDLQDFFSEDNVVLVDAIREGIETALEKKKTEAEIIEIALLNSDTAYDLTFTSEQWPKALKRCLTFYEEQSLYDQAIDTWQLINKLEHEKDSL
jgi:hypothetical protein